MERRTFVKGAATAGALAAGPVAAAGHISTPGEVPDVVLHDPRYQGSRDFALELEARGALALSTELDAGSLWYGRLGEAVASGARSIAGLTLYADLFLLQELARRAGFELAYSREQLADCRSLPVSDLPVVAGEDSVTARPAQLPGGPGLLLEWRLVKA